jgi:hypothetical protein
MSMARITASDAERGVKITSETVRSRKLMAMVAVVSPWAAKRRTKKRMPTAKPPTLTIRPMSSTVPKTDHHEPRTRRMARAIALRPRAFSNMSSGVAR